MVCEAGAAGADGGRGELSTTVEGVKTLAEQRPQWVAPILESATINAEAVSKVGDGYLHAIYQGKRLRFKIINTVFSADRCEAMLYAQLDKILD